MTINDGSGSPRPLVGHGERRCRSARFCSRFCKALSPVAKDLYLDRLTVMNQQEGDVPYLYDCRFVDDLKIYAAPPVDHAGWIFTKAYSNTL